VVIFGGEQPIKYAGSDRFETLSLEMQLNKGILANVFSVSVAEQPRDEPGPGSGWL
jgi:hypothetical protein